MLYANAIGLGALGAWAFADGELLQAVVFFAERPNAVLFCVEIKILRRVRAELRVDLHAIDATLAR